MKLIEVIVGGQAGSEGKGHIAGILAARPTVGGRPPTAFCIRVAGPNAGHTVVHLETGQRYALRQLPVGLVTNPHAEAAIAAGSEVDLTVLATEIKMLEDDGIRVLNRLYIDPMATVLEPRHISLELASGIVRRIGSTGKGIGAARADRIARTATVFRDLDAHAQYGKMVDVATRARHALATGKPVQIEGTQGYQLGLHHPYYPKVTSSDCTALDFLAMARVNPWEADQLRVWVVFRPYPIRVAGDSGPLHQETSWSALGLPEEKTTVTLKTRRVGLWDGGEARAAVTANGLRNSGNVYLALTMADQVDPELAGVTSRTDLESSDLLQGFMREMSQACERKPVLVTTSDRTHVWLGGPLA